MISMPIVIYLLLAHVRTASLLTKIDNNMKAISTNKKAHCLQSAVQSYYTEYKEAHLYLLANELIACVDCPNTHNPIYSAELYFAHFVRLKLEIYRNVKDVRRGNGTSGIKYFNKTHNSSEHQFIKRVH